MAQAKEIELRTIDELKEAIPEDEDMLNERIKSLSETDRQAIKEVFDLITTEWSAAEVEAAARDPIYIERDRLDLET